MLVVIEMSIEVEADDESSAADKIHSLLNDWKAEDLIEEYWLEDKYESEELF